MSLPIEWVEKIFSKVIVNYGVEFLARYKGIPLADVKTDWSEELGGFGGDRIAFALKNLPDKPPTATQFRNLCLSAPAIEHPALPEPEADPERMRQELDKLELERQRRLCQPADYDCSRWARVILASPSGRTQGALQMARDALGIGA